MYVEESIMTILPGASVTVRHCHQWTHIQQCSGTAAATADGDIQHGGFLYLVTEAGPIGPNLPIL